MTARRTRELELEVELVSVEVIDADARLRLAYRLLLKPAGRVQASRDTEITKRLDGEERTKPE